MKRIAPVFACVLAICLLFVGCGASEADKAYDDWVKNTAPVMEKAAADYKAILTNNPGDVALYVSALTEYLAVLTPAIDKLAAIDQSKLTGDRKAAVPDQLTALQTALAGYQNELATLSQQIGAPDEGVEDEGVVDEGVVDEDYVDEDIVE